MIRELDEAVARAMGDLGEPGPVYVEIPTDVLRTHVPPQLVLDDWMRAEAAAHAPARSGRRSRPRSTPSGRPSGPLVITGRGATQARRRAGAAARRARGAVYLDTQESRGLVPADHPSVVGAMRAAAMTEADLVLVIGRKLDYQLGYGSPAVFPNARFIRIADNAGRADRQPARRAGTAGDARRWRSRPWSRPPATASPAVDQALGRGAARDATASAAARPPTRGRETVGSDGKIHPGAHLRRASRELADPDYIAIADGGDLLSFARVGLEAAHLHGRRRLRLPRRRRAVRDRRRARLSRAGR